MPIFEYKCKKCGEVFEFLQRKDEKPVCPKCKSKRLEKQLSTFGVGATKPHCSGGGECGHSHSSGCCCGGGHCCHHH